MAKAKNETMLKRPATRAGKNGGSTAQAENKVQTISVGEDQVRARAYELYLQRNGNGGTPEEDWYRAEAELRGKSA